LLQSKYFEPHRHKHRNDYISNRKFIYLPVIIAELGRYDKNASLSYEQVAIRIIEKLKLYMIKKNKEK